MCKTLFPRTCTIFFFFFEKHLELQFILFNLVSLLLLKVVLGIDSAVDAFNLGAFACNLYNFPNFSCAAKRCFDGVAKTKKH